MNCRVRNRDDSICKSWLIQGSKGTITGYIHPKEAFGSAFATELDLLLFHFLDEGSNVLVPSGIHEEVVDMNNNSQIFPQEKARIAIGRLKAVYFKSRREELKKMSGCLADSIHETVQL